jgi:hypothetical protein
MNTRWRRAVLAVVLVALVGLGRVWASGIPEQETLTYSGTLQNEKGEPVAGERSLQLYLWDSADKKNVLCRDQPQPTRRKLVNGRFSIPLNKDCVDAIKSHADVWTQLFLDGDGWPLAKLGAVPYAVEAGHAVNADRAVESFAVAKDVRVGGAALVRGDAEVEGSLRVRDRLIRTVARAHGNGPGDETDSGPIASRVLKFTKTDVVSGVRVALTDNLRATLSGGETDGACRYELRFDGESCSNPGPLVYDMYYGGVAGLNLHRADSLFGTCFGLAAKELTIQLYAGPTDGQPQANCYTGWANGYWAIEAEEVY